MKKLVNSCKAEKIPLIIGCDSNAHHIVYGSTNVNDRGESLLEYLSSTELIIQNKGNTPTFVTKIREEVIDITLSSPDLNDQISGWHVSPQWTASDHKWIKFDLVSDKVEPKLYRDPSKTDWDKFLERLSGNRQYRDFQLNTQEEIESALKELENNLVDAFQFACPLRKIYLKNSPFWSKRLEKLRKKVRRLFNKAKHKKSDPDWQNYKLARKEFKKTPRAAKRKSWLRFIDEVKDLKATAKLNKALAKDPIFPEMLKREDGSYTKSSEEVVDLLMQTHFPGTKDAQTIEPQPIRTPNATDWNIAATIVTNRRLEWAIDSFKPFKSPGSDGIYPIVMQKASSLIMKPMKRILQAVLAMGYIPESWKEVLVKFIPKPGRDTYDLANSYRPISLTSFVLKTLERMCDRYIRDVKLKLKPLHGNQHAYQAGKSVDSALHQVVFNVEKSMEFGESFQ